MATVEIRESKARPLIITPVIIAAALFLYKSSSAFTVLRSTWSAGTIAGKPGVVALGQQGLALSPLERSINYFAVIWPALVFGILIAAAVRAFVSPRWFIRLLGRGPIKTQLMAGLAGAPLMLCSCCVAPIFTTMVETSVSLGPALGLMLASPSLNPAALTLTFMLFGPGIAGMRLLLALAAVIFVGPLVERMIGIASTGYLGKIDETEVEAQPVLKFTRSIATVSIRTVPALVLGVLISMLIVQGLPAQVFASSGAKLLTILIVATAAVPLALPTFLEIPLSVSLLAAGIPAGAAVALLFAGPAINLPSLFSIARVSGWRAAAAVAILIWSMAVAGGLLAG